MTGRILIADNTVTNRIVLKVKLGAARYTVLQAANAVEALRLAGSERPDLLILDAHLPGGGAAKLCRRLKANPRTQAIPVLILDALAERGARLDALRAGADDYLAKPLDEMTLMALVRNLMRTRATVDELARRQDTEATLGFAEPHPGFARRAQVAVIAPTPETALTWRRDLGRSLPAKIVPRGKTEALDTTETGAAPDAFVIAADLSTHGDGLRLVSELRSRPATRHAVIVIQDEADAPGTVPMALDLGANAVVAGSFDAEVLAARLALLLARKFETDALRASFDERLSLAVQDPLTGLFNRRYADAYLKRVSSAAARSGKSFALMLLDLDRFKDVNDTYGHRAGDAVLKETARRLKANMREIDLLARYGGEEFVIAMPETGIDAASAVAERLRRVIADTPMHAPQLSADMAVTVSIGVAVCQGRSLGPALPDMDALIEQADAALYASKSEGRNLVTFADPAAA